MGAFDQESIPERAARRADDRRLLERYFSGDERGLVELYDRHHRRLYVYCAKIVGSTETAEDIVQEMWERIARLQASRPEIDNPLGLFFRIVRNLSINHMRRERPISVDDLRESSHPRYLLRQPSHNEELMRICMERLKPEARQILILNLYAGYRHEEIADMLGKSPGAVRQQASRAQKELRSMMVELLRSDDADASRTGPQGAPIGGQSSGEERHG